MSEWLPIDCEPGKTQVVNFYWANVEWRNPDGSLFPVPPDAPERYTVGWWDEEFKCWRENFTNHEVFETIEVGDPCGPSHYAPVLSPPTSPPYQSEEMSCGRDDTRIPGWIGRQQPRAGRQPFSLIPSRLSERAR